MRTGSSMLSTCRGGSQAGGGRGLALLSVGRRRCLQHSKLRLAMRATRSLQKEANKTGQLLSGCKNWKKIQLILEWSINKQQQQPDASVVPWEEEERWQ